MCISRPYIFFLKNFLFGIVIVSILSSCGPIDRGLLLWSHDEGSIPSGAIVSIFNKSELRNTYEIRYTDNEGEKQVVELDSWRIHIARNNSELELSRQEYEQFSPYFGIAEIQALPIRNAMGTDRSTSIIYRLSKGEMVKILSQTEDQIEIANLRDYWFEVLTSNGTRGYIFGYRLDKVDADGISTEEKLAAVDEDLENVLTNVWRPEYFQWMINENTYDLSHFKSIYRFYHDNETNHFILRTPEYELTFDYEELFLARYKEYLAIGSDLLITVYSDTRISIQYNIGREILSENFILLEENIDIEQIVSTEQERRQQLLNDLLSRGNRLGSTRYGTIQLDDTGRGNWRSYSSSGSDIFPEWFTGSFQLAYPLYLTPELQEEYDGALSFTLPNTTIRSSMNFFYTYTSRGLRLELIPYRNIDGNVVERKSRNPLIIFFTISSL